MENDLSFEGKYIELIRIYYTHIFCRVFFFFFSYEYFNIKFKKFEKTLEYFRNSKKKIVYQEEMV